LRSCLISHHQRVLRKNKDIFELIEISKYLPKKVKDAPCQEVIDNKPDLSKLPILKTWPLDGGRFITLPMVFTRDPETGKQNCGMYRMHVYDEKTTGMHWHIHKDSAMHYRKYKELGKIMPVSVAIGSDPAVIYSATAPLPYGVDEMIFAGFLRKNSVEMVKCITSDIEVPANAEIVLEGYIDPQELRDEGPFGDHTGFYSPVDKFPVFHVVCITHRKILCIQQQLLANLLWRIAIWEKQPREFFTTSQDAVSRNN